MHTVDAHINLFSRCHTHTRTRTHARARNPFPSPFSRVLFPIFNLFSPPTAPKASKKARCRGRSMRLGFSPFSLLNFDCFHL